MKEERTNETPGMGYAYEKFADAAERLALGVGDIRSRLVEVFSGPLALLLPEQLPLEYQKKYSELLILLNKTINPHKAASECRPYPPTLRRRGLSGIRNTKLVPIAREIYSIWEDMAL